ncbi:MAG: hypothetical protein R6V05_14320 [Candidatus Brocadiia bacterium]
MATRVREHFAYDWQGYSGDDLFQGDLLKRTRELEDVLSELYPYAHQRPEKYPFFVVLTQSCDLQSRGCRPPKADYITLAATRPMRYALSNALQEVQSAAEQGLGLCFSHKKNRILHFVERLLSNEEPPYFYFHPGKRTPFQEPHVAYLRITFPLQTQAHYKTCTGAKRLQLKPSFRAKLGWLTTLVFGQVGTEDFSPDERRELASEYTQGIEGLTWVKRSAFLNMAREHQMQGALSDLEEDDVEQLLEALEEATFSGMVAQAVSAVAEDVLSLSMEELVEFKRHLMSSREVLALLRS